LEPSLDFQINKKKISNDEVPHRAYDFTSDEKKIGVE
jgi:hypothetical protein